MIAFCHHLSDMVGGQYCCEWAGMTGDGDFGGCQLCGCDTMLPLLKPEAPGTTHTSFCKNCALPTFDCHCDFFFLQCSMLMLLSQGHHSFIQGNRFVPVSRLWFAPTNQTLLMRAYGGTRIHRTQSRTKCIGQLVCRVDLHMQGKWA
jgi:hypothetical protein